MDYSTHTSLLTRLSEGIDPSAWKEFHDRYVALIRGFAYRYGLQPMDCDDITQEVLLTLSKSMNGFKYDPSKGKFRSYLKTLTLRTIFRIIRQKRDQKVLGGSEIAENNVAASPEVEVMWEEEWRQYHIRRAMARIENEVNEQDRQAFAHYVVKGCSASETAEVLDLSVEQVYQAKSRILKRLGRIIAEQVKDEG